MAGEVAPSWTPDPGTVATSNLDRLMRRVGLAAYADLHRWSVENVDAFWGVVIDELAIVFVDPPTSIRGSSDATQPDWLPGARYSIVESCLKAPDETIAILAADRSTMRRVTVAALRAEVARFANGFEEAGHRPGDRIAIAMPMTVEAVVAYLGIVAAGGVVVSIADSFAPEEIALRCAITEPVAIVTQDVAYRLAKALPMYEKCAEASDVPCVVVGTGAGITLRSHDVAWPDFLSRSESWNPVVLSSREHTNILFSSGTTGEPKAIPWDQTTPIKAAMDGRYHHDIHAGDVVAWPTNLGWMMGPWLIYASLINGAAMALYPDAPTTRGFIDFVGAAGVTMLGLVPSIVAAWRATDLVRPGDLDGVRVLSSTGEASNPDDYAWLMRMAGSPVIEYCGGTEIGGGYITGTVLHPAIPSRFTTPALGTDLVIVDESGSVTNEGEVFLVPPSIGMSIALLNRDHHDVYYADVPSGLGPLRRHGDHLRREDDGTYRALGRVDDTMNLGGIKVSSAEIETVVAEVRDVAEVAAVAVPPVEGGPDRLVLFVVPASGEATAHDPDSLRDEMQALIRGRLNPLFRIHDVVIVDSLPRTASHKVMRRLLRSGYTP
ncbi:MAG TPA: AMP-binding protein [Acidimicrobiia bacterium]|nr:AMP-binding protein [Acidimicrobiia bacterium]